MRFLHTSDWHLGKSLRGRSRLAEQEAVLEEIVATARAEAVDVVLVVGDLFESAAPAPDAEGLAWRTLMRLAADGTPVVVVAGNHDNPFRLEALRPLLAAAGITVLGHPTPAEGGGVVEVRAASGERAQVALLPFCSQRYAVRAAQLMAGDAAANAQDYAARMAEILGALARGFTGEAVNVVAAHAMVTGGVLGGGERKAQTIFDYYVNATAFPVEAHYVALGHLHRTQSIAAGCPIWYCGSPLQLDFGESEDTKTVLVVDAHPGTPATVRPVPIAAGRRLRTLRGTLAELEALAGTTGDAYLRVYVREQARVGLADEVRALFPEAVDVIVDTPGEEALTSGAGERRAQRSPTELFGEYLDQRGVNDSRLEALFARLLDDEIAAASEA